MKMRQYRSECICLVVSVLSTHNHPSLLGGLGHSKSKTGCRANNSPLGNQVAFNSIPRGIQGGRESKFDYGSAQRVNVFGRCGK